MNQEHHKRKLPEFVHGELSPEEHKAIAAHLGDCDECRREYDQLALGSAMMSRLQPGDAPLSVWSSIQEKLDGRDAPQMASIPEAAWFDLRKVFALAASVVMVSVIVVAVYLGLLADQTSPVAIGPALPAAKDPTKGPDREVRTLNGRSEVGQSSGADPGQRSPEVAGWKVETLEGSPSITNGARPGEIAIGQMLETDSRSKARITVADIGSVEVAPNSRIKLVRTGKDEHRLALDRGQLHAKIFAPPRLFVVDTPSGTAVDLGCEYTLQVDRVGNSILHVTGGFVALEDRGRESIVPAGMMCMTKKGKGIGTPFAVEADLRFRKALEDFDFGAGGSRSVRTLLEHADFYDMVTLWHLLSRVSKNDRGAIYDRLAEYVKPPTGVTRGGILRLDKNMLSAWRTEVEYLWFN
ncbi:MAG TPA: FecR domain-containing protein [Pyrinomonadaceae bacterium]|nr:FecR domain-containing protein [Pyrinomonadaceae bacterium]